jgi:hypothetical protein
VGLYEERSLQKKSDTREELLIGILDAAGCPDKEMRRSAQKKKAPSSPTSCEVH